MNHLICRAFYDSDYEDTEYTPTYFIMEIDEPVLKYLENRIKSVQQFFKADTMSDLRKVEFYFGFGMWTEFNETLEDNFQEEIGFSGGVVELCEDEPLVELKYLQTQMVEIYPDGDFRFSCFGKYSGEKFYTCLMSLDELQKENKND